MSNINRRKVLFLSLAAPIVSSISGCKHATMDAIEKQTTSAKRKIAPPNPLTPPIDSSIPVAFLLSEDAVVIDFCGPWEVFERVPKPKGTYDAFNLYTVAETRNPIRTAGGMKILPEYTIENCAPPKVIVIPAQHPVSEKTKAWIREASKHTDVTMSVCTGAFVLASTGLLSGKPATTHHAAYSDLEANYPDIKVQRGARFVEVSNLATAGGLTSGIDLALRVVQRYFGNDTTIDTATLLEYQGEGWLYPDSNAEFATRIVQHVDHPHCVVCGMDPDRSLSSVYKGKTYYFCMHKHKNLFDANPEQFIAAK